MQVPLYASEHQSEYNRIYGVIFWDVYMSSKRFHIVDDSKFSIFLLKFSDQLKYSKIIEE
jgi:hypothetical protein